MPTYNEELVNKVRQGELAIENTDHEELKKLIKHIFPKDMSELQGRYPFYFVHPDGQDWWHCDGKPPYKTLPVSSFFSPDKGSEEGWILEKDRKPEFGVPVLVFCRIYGRFIATYERLLDTNWGNWRHENEKGILPPTHWQHLP